MRSGERLRPDGAWLLVEIEGEQVDETAPRQVRFEDGHVGGRVGVNRFSGSYSVAWDAIEFGPAALTRMAGPPELMDLESRFHALLLQAREIGFDETRLVIGHRDLVMEPDTESE